MALRIRDEYFKVREDRNPYISVCLDQNNLWKWRCSLVGPEDTPYSGGLFLISIEFKDDYPVSPPSIFFQTPIYHPNIASNGAVCISLLDKDYRPSLLIAQILICIVSLMANPRPDDFMPDRAEIAMQLTNDKPAYEKTARDYTARHAM